MVQKEGDNDQANDQEEEGTEGESGEEELEYDEEEQEEVKKILNTWSIFVFFYLHHNKKSFLDGMGFHKKIVVGGEKC